MWFVGNPIDDATVQHVWKWTGDGVLTAITTEPGVHTRRRSAGATVVLRSAVLDTPGAVDPGGRRPDASRRSPRHPLVTPNVTLHHYGDRSASPPRCCCPHDHDGSPLPVLLDPYGGPHAQRVVQAHNAFLTSQWFADQGFAVVVADGRGTPGPRQRVGARGAPRPRHPGARRPGRRARTPPREEHPLDLARVAIRGWSFGGYLAALAVLRRPDVFHAAIAGAPVTEWRLYDTHYTERYLGDPDASTPRRTTSAACCRSPIELDAPAAARARPGRRQRRRRPHPAALAARCSPPASRTRCCRWSGVTHMTPQEVVAENLLLHQLEFLRRSLPRRPSN